MKNRCSAAFRTTRVAAVLVALFVFAIPWWWQFIPRWGNRIVLGAPGWFICAIGGSIVISATTVWCLQLAWQSLDLELDASQEDARDE